MTPLLSELTVTSHLCICTSPFKEKCATLCTFCEEAVGYSCNGRGLLANGFYRVIIGNFRLVLFITASFLFLGLSSAGLGNLRVALEGNSKDSKALAF